jgi:hypothetical protein
MNGQNDDINKSIYNTQDCGVTHHSRNLMAPETSINPYQRNNNNNSTVTTLNLENIIQQLESNGIRNKGLDVVPYLKNLLQVSCSEVWNLSQICRYSEWTLNLLEYFNHHNCCKTSKYDVRNDTNNENDNIIAISTYAVISLYQLMESHWDDLQVYTSLMTRNDDDTSSSRSEISLLDSIVSIVCMVSTSFLDSTQHPTYGLLHASVSALATAWVALDRLESLLTSSLSYDQCVNIRSRSIFDAPWWIQQNMKNRNTHERNETDPIQTLCHIAVLGISMDQDEWQRQQMSSSSSKSGLQLCEYKTNCANLLVQILDYAGESNEVSASSHEHKNKFQMTRAEWISVLRQLVHESLRLNDTNMPVSSFAVWSLSAFHLIDVFNSLGGEPYWVSSSFHSDDDDNSIIQQFSLSDEYRRILQSSDVVDHVIRATFWSSGINLADDSPRPKPRWTQQADTQIVQRSFSLIKEMYRSSPVVIGNNLGHHPMVKHFLYTQFRSLLMNSKQSTNGGCSKNPDKLSHLLWLHSSCRNLTRDALKDVVQKQQSSLAIQTSVFKDMFYSVMEPKNNPSQSLSAIIFLKSMLEDGLVPLRHDELSREVWKCIDVRFVNKCVDEMSFVLSFIDQHRKSSTSEYHKTLLLAMIDLLIILVSKSDSSNEETPNLVDFTFLITESLQSKQAIEHLLNLVAPHTQENADTSIVDTTMNVNNLSLDSYGETPPVNNLSRTENRSIIDNIPEHNHMQSRGFTPALQLAVATLLAELGNFRGISISISKDAMESYKRYSVLRGRMLNASNSFISFYEMSHYLSGGIQVMNYDITRRRVKLLTILSSGENEELMSRMVHSFEQYQAKNHAQQTKQIRQLKEQIQCSRQREQMLQMENDSHQHLLSKQQLRFQKDKCEWQRSVAQNTKNLVDIHIAERSKAERRAQELSLITADAERQLADADRTVQQYRAAEVDFQSQLEQSTKKVQDILSREQDMCRMNEAMASELSQLKKEHSISETAIQHAEMKEKQMREKYIHQKESLAYLGQSEGELKHSLENLFADMCSLAYLYEIKEREVSKCQESGDMVVDKLKRKLELERQRYVELDERQKRIQYENDMLSKKYAKARDKLEEERDDRRKENERRKRATPVSYINHLHSTSNQSFSGKGGSREESHQKPPPLQYTSFHSNSTDTTSRHDKENNSTSRSSTRIGAASTKDRDHSSSRSRNLSSSTNNNSRSYR